MHSADQPATQPCTKWKQTTLTSFFKPKAISITAPATCSTSSSTPSRRQLQYLETVTPQHPHGSDDDDDVPLGALLARDLNQAPELPSRAQSAQSAVKSTNRNVQCKRRVVQTQLDFGQELTAAAECPVCGMLCSNTEEDMALHRRTCRRLAAAAAKRLREELVSDLFSAADEPLERRPKPLRKKKQMSSNASCERVCAQAIEALVDVRPCPLTWWCRPRTSDLCSASCIKAFVIRQGADAKAVWARRCPALVEMLSKFVGMGGAVRRVADALRLRAADAAARELYDSDEGAHVIVLVLDERDGQCVAAVAGQHVYRMQDPVLVSLASSIDGISQLRSQRRHTLCDVSHIWVADRRTPQESVTRSSQSREDFLVGHLLRSGAAPVLGSKRTDPAQDTDASAWLRYAIECLGHHVVYGRNLSIPDEVSFARVLLAPPSDAPPDEQRVAAVLKSLLPSVPFSHEDDEDLEAHNDALPRVVDTSESEATASDDEASYCGSASSSQTKTP